MGSRQSDIDDERAVARALARLAPLSAPTEPERDRIRQRIVTGLEAPRRAGRAPRGRRAGKAKPRGSAGARARFAVASVAVLALLGALAGMSLLMAKDALPGDALYGIKRTAEAASLGLAFGDAAEAAKHLEFAGARVDEITTLAGRYPDPGEAPLGGYLTAFTDFDNDAKAGSRKLIALGTMSDGDQLRELGRWAQRQRGRLDAVESRLPPAARERAARTDRLLARIEGRAGALSARMSCYQITSGERDDIGALPATGACDGTPGEPRHPSTRPPDAPDPEPPSAPPKAGVADAPGVPAPTPPVPKPPAPPRMAALPPVDTRPQPPQEPPQAPPGAPAIVVPLPTPPLTVPPLLPGLPAINLGG